MPKDMDQDVLFIKKWIEKESYLPRDIDDIMLRKFLHSCYGSLERTKKCIERFCTTRSEMSEVYTKRDPLSPNVQTAFSITYVSTYVADDNEILIHQLDEPTLDKFVFYDLVKSFSIQGDFWLRKNLVFPEKHIIVLDIKDYALKIITKVNIMFFRDFVIYLLEGMPVRVKQVHVINCPSYYEKLYALVKPALPSEICEIINFHPTAEGLHKFIDKKFLPQEYGGDAQSMREQHRNWVKEIEENRSMFLDDNLWKADIKKKPKTEAAMSGSFRTLAID